MEEQTSLQHPEHQMSLSESVVANILSKMSTQIKRLRNNTSVRLKKTKSSKTKPNNTYISTNTIYAYLDSATSLGRSTASLPRCPTSYPISYIYYHSYFYYQI